MVRCEFLLNPYQNDWLDEGAIVNVQPQGMRLEPSEWAAWVAGGPEPDLAVVRTTTKNYLRRAIARQRLLEQHSGDHMAFWAACVGHTDFDEETAMREAGEVESVKAKVAAVGWDSNWGFMELRTNGVLMFDADPMLVQEYLCPKESFDPEPAGPLVREQKRLYRIDFRAHLSGASLNRFLDLDRYVPPNRNFPNTQQVPLEATTAVAHSPLVMG